MKLKIKKEYEDLVPRLEAEDYETLKESIKENGIRVKLHVLADGTILCGHTRFRIAEGLKLDNIPYEVVEHLTTEYDIKMYIIEDNLVRRQLSTAQKVQLGFAIEGLERGEAKKRQEATLPKKGEKGFNVKEKLPGHQTGQYRDMVGKKIGVSGKTFEKGKKVKEENPELWNQCLSGDKSLDAAFKEMIRNGAGPMDDSGEIARNIKHELFKLRTITTNRVLGIKDEQKRVDVVMDIVRVIGHLQSVVDAIPVDNIYKAKNVNVEVK